MSLGNCQLPYSCDVIRKYVAWDVLCLFEREGQKSAVNSAGVQNVCARTALTDSSSNKKQLQGTVIILTNFCNIQLCVVAWGMEETNKINFFNFFL